MKSLVPGIMVAIVISLFGASTALAKSTMRPVEPFYTATARPGHTIVLRNHPGGAVLATLGTQTRFGSVETVGIAKRRGNWVGVISTDLPNGVIGWVSRQDIALRAVTWSVSVSLSKRQLVVRHGNVVVRQVAVGIGASSSPTPTGRYVITDHLDPGAQSSVYGCCILALSGHQPHPPVGWSTTQDWRLAIHGGATGAVSAGCIHADEETLRFLMRFTPLGTPVTITR